MSVGFLITTLRELRAGVYTPPPEVRPEVDEGTDEVTTEIFKRMRDFAYQFKEHTGLEWQHLLPGILKVCVIYCIKYRGKEGALELFLDLARKLQPVLDKCRRNPPQQLPITPVHIANMAKFDELLLSLAEIPNVYPGLIAIALNMLFAKLAWGHYDLIFLSEMYASSCADIERGKYDVVKKTH
jgi:hypothetical protein